MASIINARELERRFQLVDKEFYVSKIRSRMVTRQSSFLVIEAGSFCLDNLGFLLNIKFKKNRVFKFRREIKMNKKNIKRIIVGVLALFIAVVATACSGSKSDSKDTSASKTIKVGIVGSDDRVWKPLAQELKKQGINIKLVEFNNYDQPNQALESGDVDLNAYQHIYFLDNWNEAHKTNLVSIGNTVIAPLAVFSKKIQKLSELKKGDVVTLPNDATNQARALQLLETAGIITLKKGVKLPTPADVETNKVGINLKPLDASQTARSLDDATAAIINNTVALDAKLSYETDAIYVEKITAKSKIWVNIIAAKKENKDNATYKKIVKAYQTKSNAARIKKVYEGSTIPAWDYKF